MKLSFLYSEISYKILCADLENLINSAAASGLELYDVKYLSPYSAELKINFKDKGQFEDLLKRKFAEGEIIKNSGPKRLFSYIKKRKVLSTALILLLVLLKLSSLFIWDLELISEGEINEARLLNALYDKGLYCGAYKKKLKPDRIRDKMLSEFPEINFMAINIKGQRAELLIEPMEKLPPMYKEDEPLDLVASASGIIKSVEALKGRALINPGDYAEKGMVLIEGKQDLFNGAEKEIQAKGSVIAETNEEITAVTPLKASLKGDIVKRKIRFGIKFGNKRKNFYNNSGKHIDGCVKIIKEYKLGRQDLFSFPLSLIKEELIFYELHEGPGMKAEALQERLLKKLQGLNVTQRQIIKTEENGLLKLKLQYSALRDIAEPRRP